MVEATLSEAAAVVYGVVALALVVHVVTSVPPWVYVAGITAVAGGYAIANR